MVTVPAARGVDLWFHRLVAESGPDLHTITTVDGVYRFVSPASLALFGWEPDGLVGRNQDEFAHPDDLALIRAARRAAVAGPAQPTMCRFRCADSSYRWTEALSTVEPEGDGVLVVSSVRDIGNRKDLEIDHVKPAS